MIVSAVVLVLVCAAPGRGATDSRPRNCAKYLPRHELRCARRQLRLARAEASAPIASPPHSLGYWHWRIKVAKRWIRDARYRLESPRAYTMRIERERFGWGRADWIATDALVGNESGWDSCAHWPSVHHDCTYDGTVLCANGICSNACGIPQATPCPDAWRGHLDRWREQVWWMLRYIARRYGTPSNAYYHETHGGY